MNIIVLPGSTSPYASEIQEVYSTIEDGAQSLGFECQVVAYPGQQGVNSGRLTYASAVERAITVCRERKPAWIIGRCFGCEIACGILASGEPWVGGVRGAVLWGPGLLKRYRTFWPTAEKQRKEIEDHKAKGTWLASDCLDTLPGIESLIQNVRCKVRIARGTADEICKSEDVYDLYEIHHRSQPDFSQPYLEVPGLDHYVFKSKISADHLAQYYDCLFAPFPTAN